MVRDQCLDKGYVQEVQSGPANGVVWKAFAGSLHKTLCAVGRLRQTRVMEKIICWRTKPSGQKKRSCLSCVKKSKGSKGKMPSVQFEDIGEDAKPDDDCKMEVEGEADSRKKLEMRKKR